MDFRWKFESGTWIQVEMTDALDDGQDWREQAYENGFW